MGKLDEVLMQYFKVKTRSVENPIVAAAGAAAVLFLRNNPDRLAWTFVNLSANIIYLGLTNLVSAVNGIYIAPNGGSVSLNWEHDFQMVSWGWWCIAPAGASAFYCLEVIGE